MSILSLLYDKRDCATLPPLRIISAEAMKGELSRLQGRARCIVAHPDRLRGGRAAGQDQRRVPCAGCVRAAVYTGRAGQQRRHVHRHRRRADDHGVQPDNSRAAALYLRTHWGISSSAMSAGMISCAASQIRATIPSSRRPTCLHLGC